MHRELLELTTKNELLPLYNVYKDCMYLSNKDKYREKVQSWLMDDWIRIFACVHDSKRKGLPQLIRRKLSVFQWKRAAEIVDWEVF